MSGLSRRHLDALTAIAAGENSGRPARISDRTTPAAAVPTSRWFNVHYRTARTLIDRGLAVDIMGPKGDGLYLTAAGRAAVGEAS